MIEEAPELAKNRRERWWRNTQFWAAFSTESWVTLTPERLEQLGNRIGELVQKYVETPSEGPAIAGGPAVLARQSMASDSSCEV